MIKTFEDLSPELQKGIQNILDLNDVYLPDIADYSIDRVIYEMGALNGRQWIKLEKIKSDIEDLDRIFYKISNRVKKKEAKGD